MIECVANISEGRDAAVIEAITAALRFTEASLLDVHVDPDHHRSVLTLAGATSAVEDAALVLAEECIARMDLRTHCGVHPRMGVLDVVPFVPLAPVVMDDAVAVARRVALRIAAELSVPVFLYGEAATRPERRRLAAVRGRGFESLEARMRDEGFRPDFGPSAPHRTAGATAVGARGILIAYNVQLETADVSIARRIASAVRESSGGLRGVQALGLSLATRGCAQVSMNLVGPCPPLLLEVFGRVSDLARAYGTRVRSTEIVGLAPRAALRGATRETLLLDGDLASHILEDRLAAEVSAT
ncbi:MAG: glutamate formimidoyltransferase [Candidatus Bipolaricaulis sp.]|nr:glutamate formimidoyltransferase [Candidatus Bipolaricaulis sp.]MDD5646857.1 glutamate formimidoyltransferase [Candidatus Bipolaricaulis sp.]